MRFALTVFATWAALGCGVMVGQVTQVRERRPQPDEAAIARATKVVRDLFRVEFDRQKLREKYELAVTLFQQGLETNEDDAARFALFNESLRLAAEAGEISAAWCVVDQLSRDFEVPPGRHMLAVVQAVATAPVKAATRRLNALAALSAVDQSVTDDDLETAQRVLEVATAEAAEVSSDPLIKARVTSRQRELDQVRDLRKAYEAAVTELGFGQPQGNAALTIGKYLCFVKGDWREGLPILRRGQGDPAGALAADDMALPTDANLQADLADRWWVLAEDYTGLQRRRIRIRACRWYTAALMRLAGLSQTQAQARLTEVVQEFPELELSSEVSLYAAYAGLWEINYTNSAKRYYCVDPRGCVYTLMNDSKTVARANLTPRDRKFELAFNPKIHSAVEKIQFAKGELQVEHFNPPGKLSCTGVGTLHLLPELRPTSNHTEDSSAFAGIWTTRVGTGAMRIYHIGPAGSVVGCDERTLLVGLILKRNDDVLIDVGFDKLERIRLHGMTMRIETFFPASSYPSSPAATTGIGINVWR